MKVGDTVVAKKGITHIGRQSSAVRSMTFCKHIASGWELIPEGTEGIIERVDEYVTPPSTFVIVKFKDVTIQLANYEVDLVKEQSKTIEVGKMITLKEDVELLVGGNNIIILRGAVGTIEESHKDGNVMVSFIGIATVSAHERQIEVWK